MAEGNNQQIRARRYALEAAETEISRRRCLHARVNLFATARIQCGIRQPALAARNAFIGIDVAVPIYAGGANRAREIEARPRGYR